MDEARVQTPPPAERSGRLERAGDPGWVTYPRTTTRTRLVSRDAERDLGRGRLGHGAVEVVSRTTGYVRVDVASGAVLALALFWLLDRPFDRRRAAGAARAG